MPIIINSSLVILSPWLVFVSHLQPLVSDALLLDNIYSRPTTSSHSLEGRAGGASDGALAEARASRHFLNATICI